MDLLRPQLDSSVCCDPWSIVSDPVVLHREQDPWLQIHLYNTRKAGEANSGTWTEEEGLIRPTQSGEIELAKGRLSKGGEEPVVVRTAVPLGSSR